MIELKSMTVEKNDYYTGNHIDIELNAPFNLDIYELHRKFQRMIDMENRELNKSCKDDTTPNTKYGGRQFLGTTVVARGNLYDISKIYYNKEKATTVVVFAYRCYTIRSVVTEEDDPQKVIVKRDSEDRDDIYMAVASAVMIRKYKSNSQFKAHLRRSTPKGAAEIPGIYQVAAAYEVSEIYGSWEKFCKIVDEKLEVYHGKRKETNAR